MSAIDQIPEHAKGILRSIGMLYDESTFPGKVHYDRTASLSIKFSAGCMIDFENWIPAAQHQEYFGTKFKPCYHEIKVKILLNDDVIYNSPMLTDTVDFHYEFSDNTAQPYTLKISVDGLFNRVSRQIENIGFVSHMLRIHDVKIENLPMTKLLEGHGVCYFQDNPTTKNVWAELVGKPGYQQFEFESPIYTWLLDNFHE